TSGVATDVSLVEYLPARYGVVRVHRLADLDVGVGFVAEPLAAPVHVDRPGPLTPLTQRGRRRIRDESHWQPPGLVQQVRLGAKGHGGLKHLGGVARIGDGPLRLVRLTATVLPPHVGVAAESSRGEQNTLSRLNVDRRAISTDACADHAAVLDDEVLH